MYRPSPAERARTVLRAATSLGVLTTDHGAHVVTAYAVDADGTPTLLLPESCRPAGDTACVVRAVDVSPAALPDRTRGEVWLAGWLEPAADDDPAAAGLIAARGGCGPLLRLHPAEVRLRDLLFGAGHTVDVDPDAYADARPDPLIDGEADWLGHLVASHPEEYAQLCQLVPDHARPPGTRLHPVALDRFGLLLRIDAGAGHRHVRLPFPEPVCCPGELPQAMAVLLRAATAAPSQQLSE